jgi:hypothetical protein
VGVAFSDFKALKSDIPANGKPFPGGSKIGKIQWKVKKSTETRSSSIPTRTDETYSRTSNRAMALSIRSRQ